MQHQKMIKKFVFVIFFYHYFWVFGVEGKDQTTTNGEFSKDIVVKVDSKADQLIVFKNDKVMNPFRVTTASLDADHIFPVLVVLWEEGEVNSWELPYALETKLRYVYFQTIARTICPRRMTKIYPYPGEPISDEKILQNFQIMLSTSSPQTATVTVRVDVQNEFVVESNTKYFTDIMTGQPIYYFFKYKVVGKSHSHVLLEVDSDESCFTVSIQKPQCPVLTSNKDVQHEGMYQTVTKKGAFMIAKKAYPNGFLIVFVEKPTTYDCYALNSAIPSKQRQTVTVLETGAHISFQIRPSMEPSEYLFPVLVTLGVIAIFMLVTVIATILFYKYEPLGEAGVVVDDHQIRRRFSIDQTLSRTKITLDALTREVELNPQRSFNYLWHVITIGLFYGIPVVELVFTHQKTLVNSGDQDLCYYNFRCAYPLYGISDFNHVFSNIAYVILGIFFMGVTYFKHRAFRKYEETGVPQCSGLYYSMGIALIMEGVLSACYHVCPSQSNFQFDTSFMYAMAILCAMKLYQNRHPDMNATAYTTFTAFGIATLIVAMGIMSGGIGFWALFIIGHIVFAVHVSINIYFLGYVKKGYNKVKEQMAGKPCYHIVTVEPFGKRRFVFCVMSITFNVLLSLCGFLFYFENMIDLATYLLFIFMFNTLYYLTFYIIMKIIKKERFTVQAILYLILSLGFAYPSTKFFVDHLTEWTRTPAESRELNDNCILLNFYDEHDVWHLLSAFLMFFIFMTYLTLDDGIARKAREKIDVF